MRILQVEGYVGVRRFLLMCLFNLQCGSDNLNLSTVRHGDSELLWSEQLSYCRIDAALKGFPPYRYVDVGSVGWPSVWGFAMFRWLLHKRSEQPAR